MALLKGKESKEEKKERKEQELLEKFGLEDLHDPRDIETVKTIAREMAGNSLFEIGALLNFKAKEEDLLQIFYLRTLVEQNFIIIRQLDKIAQAVKE